MSKKKDITQTGPVGLRGIRNSDLYDYLNSGVGNSAIVRQALSSGPSTPFGPNKADDYSRYYEPTVEEDTSWKELGNSSYDAPYMIGSDPSYIGEHRAQEQSGITQLANGILKGVGLAGTTFLDGTVGLLAGVADGIYNAANGEGWEGFAEGFFNNDVSRTLREVNAEMEKILPNYRTKDEIENPWALRNIFSMNTFADDFLKNMGFTVGAFYSGNAFLGALKGVGLAAKMSKTAASTIGSVVSGFNEGRIEAGNLYDEMLTAEIGNLKAARDQAEQDILNSPEYQAAGQSLIDEYNQKRAAIEAMPDKLVPNGEGGFVNQKQQALIQLGNEYSGRLSQLEQQAMADIDRRYDQQVKDAQHRAAQAGIADMILNTLYLPAENMFAYGKLYGRKFKPKADLKKGVKEKAIDVAAREADLEETMGRRIAREGKEYVATPRSAKKAALRGLGVGISEGAEEINQSAMSSFASNLYQPDSPDAYYKALTNDDYHMETKDAMTAFSEAMVDSWGNSDTYKEGLVGFLTGLIGMPTFGRVNNSDAVTYLGKGSPVALSGGILGEISNNRRLNAEANRAVDAMNKVVKLASDTENFFVRMNSFYDAKAGFSEENDKFEFNNAADNELFHAIDAFRRSGRMQDLKDIIDENFDNITPEQLADIAEKTTGEDNLWSDIDGTSMAATPDGQTEMKRILNDRKQEIMDGIESYEKALDEVRSIANNSLDEDQTAELAWLKWKVDKFGKRYSDIKENNRDLFTDISNALLNYRDELQNGIDDSVADDEDNIAVQELNKTNNLIKFIAELQGAPTPMALSAILEAHPNFVKYFTRTDSQFAGYDSFNGMLGVSYDQYERAWNELRDCTRLAKAAKDFDSRYKEFTQDPIKLIKNRQKIDAQNAKQEESKKNLKGRNLLDSDNVSDIVKAVDNGEMSLEDMQKLIDTDDDSDVKEQRQQMYNNAEAILKKAQELEDKLNALADEPGADPRAIEDAKKQLEKQKYLVENAEQLADTSTEAMNTMEMSDEDVQRALAAGQALEDAEAERIDKAKELIKSAEAQLEEAQQALGNMPTEMPKGLEEAVAAAEVEETGHDGPTAAPAVNEPQAQDGPAPINYYDIAYSDINAFVPAYSEPQKTGAATALAKIYAEIDSLHREGTLSKQSGIMLETKDSFKDAGRLIGDNNVRKLISDRIDKVLANDAAQLAPNDPAPVTNQDPITPDTSNIEAIEKQIDAEANRSLDEDGRQDSYNYWKRTTTQYFIHSARAAWEKTIDWIKRQGKSPQQVRRTEAVYQFLEDHHAWDNINAGAVAMKGRKGPTIKFITSKKLNDDAGEFVVLMVDSQGRIVGDLGSKNDIGTHRQVGLVDFLDAAEKEYNEKKDKNSEDIVPLTGETTVLQNLVGRVDYAPKDQRRSLNEIWGGKRFTIALARKSGKNSGMRTNSLSLSATGGKDDIGDYTLSPLDAVAGQPYVLVESSDPARRYIPVPFSMPVFSPATTNSALGQAVLKVLMTVSEEDFKTIRDPLRALLAVEDVRIGWGTKTDKNADRVTLTIQRNGKKEHYSAQRSDPNAGTVLFNKLAQAGIPFHVNRAFINGTYGPTGQPYNEMIGELAQTNLNSTHTVGDWFTVNPIGAKGTRMKSIGINPEAEANQKAAEAVAARSAGRITVKYNGFEYTVDKDTWKAYNSEDKELTGAFALQVVALAQCQLNGYDTTKPGPYQIPLGWYNPVTGALNRGTSKPEPQTPAQKQQGQYQFPERQATLLPVPSYASENPWSVGKNGANKRKISGGQTILTGEAIQSYVNVIYYAIKVGIIRGVELIDGPEGSGAKYITEDDWDDAVEQLEELGFKTPRELAMVNIHTYDVRAARKAARQQPQSPAQPQGQQPQQSPQRANNKNQNEPSSVEERIIITSSAERNGEEKGDHTAFGKEGSDLWRKQIDARNITRATDRDKYKIADRVYLVERPNGVTTIAIGPTGPRGGAYGIHIWRKLTDEEKTKITELLRDMYKNAPPVYNSYGESDKMLAQYIDDIMHDTGSNQPQQSTTQQSQQPQITNPDDAFLITRTYEGLSRLGGLQEWSKKSGDVRSNQDGWGTYNGLTYYKVSLVSGRGGDNVTVWFRTEPTAEQKKQIEEIGITKNGANIVKQKLLDVLNASAQQSSTPQAGQSNNQPPSREFNAETRVADSKLPHKEELLDVFWDTDGLFLNIQHPTLPNLLMILYYDRGKFRIQVREKGDFKAVQGTPEMDAIDHIWSAEEIGKIVDRYLPKDLQQFITSGEERRLNMASQERADKLYPDSIKDRVKYMIFDPENSHEIVKNKWGIYWINQYTEDSNFNTQGTTTPTQTPPTQDVLAKMTDILDDDTKQAVWDSLTDEQKQALANKSTKKIEQILDTIVEEAWDGTKVDNFESYLGARFRRGEVNRTSRKWNEKKERAWLQQILPQFSGHRLRVLRENLIQISDGENPTWAYGQFKNGIITLGKAAAKGTLYHEAFHAVTWCLFNESERHQMLEAAKGKYRTANPIALEEQLAEDFRKYVQLEELPVVGRLVRFFRTLKQFIRSLTGKENYIDKVFYSISRGAYANREVQNTDVTRLNKPTAEEEEILRNAPRDAEGRLLAPNGKPSNLTERQYVQVRTKAFKNWFGDWENDHENSSKVVDKNGEPLVVYHHTDNPNLTEFSIDYDNYFSTKKDGTKAAIFFDENKTGTLGRKYDIPVFLNIRNLRTYTGTKEDLHKAGTSYTQVVNESAKANPSIGGLHMADFDDNRLEHQDVWIAHNPTQIKSATDNIGTFDPNNPDIRYRKVLPSEAATKSLQSAKHTLTIINSSPIDITKLGSYLSDLFKRYKDRFSSEEKFTEEIKFYASLIEYLRRNNAINENGVLFKFLTVPKANGDIVQGFRNYYGIGINQKVPFEDEPIVLLHEIIHSATVAAIENPKTEAEKTFAKKLTALYKYVVDWNNKNHMIPSDEYGLTDVYEFVAEMANPYFLQSLSMIEVTSDYPYLEENAQRIRKSNPNRSNALVQFLNALKEYLGALWRHKANMAHAQLLSIYDEWVTNSGPEKFDGVFVGSKTGDKIRKEGVVSYARLGIEQSKPIIEQYHRDRLEFGNLSQEQKDYIKLRGITLNEYNRMSEFEREVLFECMGI